MMQSAAFGRRLVGFILVLGATWCRAEVGEDKPAALAFDDALRFLLTKNLTLSQAEIEQRITGVRREEAEALYLPSASALGKVERSWSGRGGDSNEQTARLSASLNLYKFGADRAAIEAATARQQYAVAMYQDAQMTADRTAFEALLSVVMLEMELAVSRKVHRLQESNLALARKLYLQGLRSSQDVDKNEIEASNEAARMRDVEMRLVDARASLHAAAGMPMSIEAKWPWLARFQKLRLKTVPPVEAKDVVHPDREALVAKLRTLEAEKVMVGAGQYPSLDAGVDYDLVRRPEYDQVERAWSGRLTVSLPLFDRLAVSAEKREKLLRHAQVQEELAAKDRTIASESVAARRGFTIALETAQMRDETLAKVRALYNHSLKSFQAGVLSTNELHLDRARLYETELSNLRGWEAVHRYYLRLCQSMGQRILACDVL